MYRADLVYPLSKLYVWLSKVVARHTILLEILFGRTKIRKGVHVFFFFFVTRGVGSAINSAVFLCFIVLRSLSFSFDKEVGFSLILVFV